MFVKTITFFKWRKKYSSALVFLKRCGKYFTSFDLLTIYRTFIRPQMEYNYYVWADASRSILKLLDRVQKRVKVLINDNRVSNSVDTLEHRRNVACVSLFYRYCNGRCSREIRALIPDNHIFLRSTRTSRRAHPFVLGCVVNLTMHCTENAFLFFDFSRSEVGIYSVGILFINALEKISQAFNGCLFFFIFVL